MNHSTPLELHDGIYFKREDYNQTGSIKDRGIDIQIKKAVESNAKSFTISSSGNAGISAAYFANKYSLPVTVFISHHSNPAKRKQLNQTSANVVISDDPLNESLLYAQEHNSFHLRQSTSEDALIGYEPLVNELIDQLGVKQFTHKTALFFPVSSGTALTGVYQHMLTARKENRISAMPQFHAVQTQYIQPIAKEFDTDFKRKSSSIVDAIVPPILPPRKDEVIEIIKKTNGSAWVVSDKEMLSSDGWLKDNGITTSFEGALALEGYRKAVRNNHTISTPIIIITGTRYGTS